MRRSRWCLAVGALLALALSGRAVAAVPCRPASVEPCRLELHGEGAPRASGSCGEEAWNGHLAFELPERFADGDADGWHEAVLRLDLDPVRGCGCAVFRITYAEEPRGYTVNIGDSPTNDGYGGDAWSSRFDAEILVLHRDLEVYGADRRDSPSESRIFGLRRLALSGKVLELEVCDQSLRFGIDGMDGFFNTYVSRELIAIRSPTDKGGDAPDSKVYAGFNRVIHRRGGRPSHDRFGRGVSRVEISLTP